MSFVVFTLLENYPIITIVPKTGAVSNTPVYVAFEQTGAGHYDAVIEVTGVDDTAISSDTETSSSNGHAPAPPETIAPEASQLVCRCGQGGGPKINRQGHFVLSTSPAANASRILRVAHLHAAAITVQILMVCEQGVQMKGLLEIFSPEKDENMV